MNQDTTYTGIDETGNTDSSLTITYTQIASCAFGNDPADRRRRSLRARLERERFERQKRLEHSFITTFRNFFSTTKH